MNDARMIAIFDQVEAAKAEALPKALEAAALARQLFDALTAEGFMDDEAFSLLHLILGGQDA